MNYTTEGCVSRGFVAIVGAGVLLLVTLSNYHGLQGSDQVVAFGLYVVALYGLLPVNLANWLFALACIAGICTLIIMAPAVALAGAAVIGCCAIVLK